MTAGSGAEDASVEPMTPERWARVESVFGSALELPPAERAAFVARSCGSDSVLCGEVLSLLEEHASDPGFLDMPPWASHAAPDTDAIPEQIGPYRILRSLGRGGMGQVYLAEREAADLRQQVALKVLRRGMDTDDLLARFRRERRILATLNHPNIARLLDAGATESGLPYFVMEYVEGEALLACCDAQRLDVRARLRLFGSICAAVQTAHRSLIVHRDLKPHNILVTRDGVPKLLDFGIAKIVDPQHSEFGAAATREDVRLLTPDYAAPEQIRGEAVTTACDVYALGVLLYELLAGCHPFAASRGTRAELERSILERDPAAPSARVTGAAAAVRGASVRQLVRQLRGDLDTIVLTALRREPEARYALALSLHEDLERQRSGRTIRARPASAGYRLRKFVARNRVGVGAAAVLFLVLGAATAITRYQSLRIREASARVERERDKALEVSSFLLEMFGATGADQPAGDTVTARELLDRRAATLDNAYPNDPEMRAEMQYTLAEGYEKLGLFEAAEPLARKSLAARQSLFGAAHPDVVASLDQVGWLQHQRRSLEEAEALLRSAVTTGRQVFAPPGDTRLARALNDLGVVREARGDFREAADLYRESLAMRRALPGEAEVGVAITTSNLAAALYRKGDLDSAVVMAQQALALFRRVLGPDHQRTTIVQSNLAAMQSARGDHEGAAQQQREIMERRRRLFGPTHASVAFSMDMLANELTLTGQYPEADSLLHQALAIQSRNGAERDLATTHRLLAELELATQRPAAALQDFQVGIALTRRVFGEQHENVATLLARQAQAFQTLGQDAQAESSLRASLRIFEKAVGPRQRNTLAVRLTLAEQLQREGRTALARAELAPIDSAAEAAIASRDDLLGQRLRTVRAALAR